GESGLLRSRSAGRRGRAAAWCGAVVALALLALRPEISATWSGTVAMLDTASATNADAPMRADARSAPSAAKAAEDAAHFRLPGAPAGGELVPDARTLWRREPGLERVIVRGDGLDAFDWAEFGGLVSPELTPLPAGI